MYVCISKFRIRNISIKLTLVIYIHPLQLVELHSIWMHNIAGPIYRLQNMEPQQMHSDLKLIRHNTLQLGNDCTKLKQCMEIEIFQIRFHKHALCIFTEARKFRKYFRCSAKFVAIKTLQGLLCITLGDAFKIQFSGKSLRYMEQNQWCICLTQSNHIPKLTTGLRYHTIVWEKITMSSVVVDRGHKYNEQNRNAMEKLQRLETIRNGLNVFYYRAHVAPSRSPFV